MGIEKIASKLITRTVVPNLRTAASAKTAAGIIAPKAQAFDDVFVAWGASLRRHAQTIQFAKDERTLGFKNKIINFFKKIPYSFISEKQKYLQNETKLFYSKTQKLEDILNFENNKAVIDSILKNPAGDWKIFQKEYSEIINEIVKNGLTKEFSFEQLNSELSRAILAETNKKINIPLDFAKKIYYKQPEMLNPNLAKLKSLIKPKTLEIESYSLKKVNPVWDFTLDEIKTILSESRDLTLDSGSFLKEVYKKGDIYDLPLKFGSASYNSLAKNGSAYIEFGIPKIFQEVDKKELTQTIDLLSTHLRECYSCGFPNGSVINFKIGAKNFTCTAIAKGMEGRVFRISSGNEPPVVLKVFYANSEHAQTGVSFAPAGIYGNLGILREAKLAKVVDVPDLYMANPIYKPISGASSGYMGAWQIVEDTTTKQHKDGLKFMDWLQSKGLMFVDNKKDAWVNGFCVDTGFVTSYGGWKSSCGGLWGDRDLNSLYAKYLNGESTEKIISLLNE